MVKTQGYTSIMMLPRMEPGESSPKALSVQLLLLAGNAAQTQQEKILYDIHMYLKL